MRKLSYILLLPFHWITNLFDKGSTFSIWINEGTEKKDGWVHYVITNFKGDTQFYTDSEPLFVVREFSRMRDFRFWRRRLNEKEIKRIAKEDKR